MPTLLPTSRCVAPSPQANTIYNGGCGGGDCDHNNTKDNNSDTNNNNNSGEGGDGSVMKMTLDLHQVITPEVSYVPRDYIWPLEETRLHLNKQNKDEVEVQQQQEDDQENENEVTNKVSKGVTSAWRMPVIDLEKLASCSSSGGEERAKLAWACEEWGGFYAVGHGVDDRVVTSASEAARHLFSLPLQTKLRAVRQENTYDGYGKANLGRFFKSLMWSEGFTMMGHPSSSIHRTTSNLCPNPNLHNPFRDAFEEYDKVIRQIASMLLTIILEVLGVKMDEFKVNQFDPEKDCQGALQLNYYPPCPDPTMTLGLAPHTDSTCLTIMHQQEGVIGLEMCRQDQWIPIPPLKDSFVVHVGDMLQVLSNGKYKSTTHRAIVNKNQSRLSIVYFCAPPQNVTIYAPHEVVESSKSRRRLYKQLKWGDYLKARNKYFVDALNTFKQH